MISVIIPLYNKENYIRTTLECLQKQTYKDFEVVVVDDGSTDRSVAIVESMCITNARIIRQANKGVSAARNKGVSEAKGEFVAFLDADDRWEEDYLSILHGLTEKYKDCDVFASAYDFYYSDGSVRPLILNRMPFDGEDGMLVNYFEVASCSHPPLWTSAVMVRKSAFEGVGGFPVHIKSGEDLIVWARLACAYKIAYTLKPLAHYTYEFKNSRKSEPKDIQSVHDDVGTELRKLLASISGATLLQLRRYIAFWYKMRASINLSLGHRRGVWRCGVESLKYNPLSPKVYALMIISVLPESLSVGMLKRLRK